MNTRTIAILGLIISGVLARLIPHPPNFTPVMATAIFAGAYLSNRWLSMLIPIGTMFVSDLIIGFHPSMLFVYGSLMIAAFLGSFLKDKKSIGRIAGITAISTILFFLITNFSTWLVWGIYPKTFAGLMLSYEMALPFLRWEALANFSFVAFFFGGFALLDKYIPEGQLAESKINN